MEPDCNLDVNILGPEWNHGTWSEWKLDGTLMKLEWNLDGTLMKLEWNMNGTWA